MKKQQIWLVGGALAVSLLLFFVGRTVTDKPPTLEQSHEHQSVTFDELLHKAKEKISPAQSQRLTLMETAVSRGDIKEQQLHVFHQLARFWADSAHIFEPYA